MEAGRISRHVLEEAGLKWTVGRNMDFEDLASESSKGNEASVIENWRKGNLVM